VILIKDFASGLGDCKVVQHSLNNDTNSNNKSINHAGEFEIYSINLYFHFANGQATSNAHYHIVSLAHLDPPFILNPLISDSDYYPTFWMAEHVRDENSSIFMPSGPVPKFYNNDRNTFFLAMRREKSFARFEELLASTLQTYGAMRCDIFYKELE